MLLANTTLHKNHNIGRSDYYEPTSCRFFRPIALSKSVRANFDGLLGARVPASWLQLSSR